MRRKPLRSFSATFREGATSSPGARGGRTFKGVTIIKSGLGNAADKHYYPAEVLQEAVESGQFKKLRAYADHQTRIDETVQPERTIRDMVGLYDNVRFVREGEKGGRVVGDLRVFRPHKWLAETVDDLIEMDAADKIGISINGAGDTEERDLKEAGGPVNQVLNFRKLFSADIVTEAGAGGGFHTLLEAAREARQERLPMTKKDLMAKISEAAQAGNAAKVTELTQQLAEATDDTSAGKKPVKKPAKPAVEKTREAKPEDKEDDEDLEEGADTDDPDAEADDADDVQESDDADLEESEDADEDGDAADESEDDGEPTTEATARRTEGSLADKFRAGTRQREAGKGAHRGGALAMRAPVNPNAKGGVKKGAGSFVRAANTSPKGRAQKGRRYAEVDASPETMRRVKECGDDAGELKAQLAEALEENASLRDRIQLREKKDMARAVVKQHTKLDSAGQKDLAAKLVRECNTEAEMLRDVRMINRLVESVAGRVRADLVEEDEDGLEGFPSRFREGSAGGDELDLESLGLPVKSTAKH